MKIISRCLLLLILFLVFFKSPYIALAVEDNTIEEYDKVEDKENNIEELEDEVTSSNSNSIVFVEIFCGVIGIVMIVLSNRTNS